MKLTPGILAATLLISVPGLAEAQRPSFFATGGWSSDLNEERVLTGSFGVVFDVPKASWLSAAAQADLFFAFPYIAGRGTVQAQLNAVRRRDIRIFGLGGVGSGENDGPVLGGGVEFRPRGRMGVRATFQDYVQRVGGVDCAGLGYSTAECHTYLHDGKPWTGHQPTVQIGVTWR